MRPQRRPYVNILLIFINIAVFIFQLSLDEAGLMEFIYQYGVIPHELILSQGQVWLPFLTSPFLHGGWFHLLGNMLYLWVFGDNVEDRLGHAGYFLFYLLAGSAGSISHIIANPDSLVPTIGASGAVAGVLGAYFILFPRARVPNPHRFLYYNGTPTGHALPLPLVPAAVFNAFLSGLNPGAQTVAWWAHIGGFILGSIFGIATIIEINLRDRLPACQHRNANPPAPRFQDTRAHGLLPQR